MSERELQQLAAELDDSTVEPEERLDTESFARLVKEIAFHSENRYWQFTPTQAGLRPFMDRLYRWVRNEGLTLDDTAVLLRVVPEVQFIDRDEMMALYRAAFSGPIKRWLFDVLSLTFAGPEADRTTALLDGVDTTWFCAITDSLDIAQFHHANQISGKDHRPSWRILKAFGDQDRIRTYMRNESVARLVLLEDFVGSGTQASGPLVFAAKTLPEYDVLFVPLIITIDGLQRVRDAVAAYPRVRVEPVFAIPRHVQVREEPEPNEPRFVADLRDLVGRTFERIKEPLPPDSEPLVEAFGFGKVGTLLVMHTNCPNNTVPLIWRRSPEWQALFPRVVRT